MKIVARRILYRIAGITGWRWLVLVSGVALLTACSGKTDKAISDKDSVPDSVRVKCYEPMELDTASTQAAKDSANKEEMPAVKDSSELRVPLHPCYVPLKPKE